MYGFIFTCNEQPTVLIALSDIPALKSAQPLPTMSPPLFKAQRNQRLTRHLKMKSEHKGKEVVCQEGEAVHLLSNVLQFARLVIIITLGPVYNEQLNS